MPLKTTIIERIFEGAALFGVLLIEINAAIFLLFIMIVAESLLGAKIAQRNNNFSWRQFARSITKIVWFAIGLLICAAANQFPGLNYVNWVNIGAGLMAAYELKQGIKKVDILTGTNIFQTVREILDARLLSLTKKAKHEKPKE
jgi:hypothetical protein